MKIIDGKQYRDELLEKYKKIISDNNLKMCLAIILVGDDAASKTYVKNKVKYCSLVGIDVNLIELKSDTNEEKLLGIIDKLNKDDSVTGIILQCPVPNGIDFKKCAGSIVPRKDIDGFTKENIFNLYLGVPGLIPCTVLGIVKLLKHYDVNLEGANVCIVGRGEIVGKPLALMLENENATVTLCHSHTKNLADFTKNADILISAVGEPNLITASMVKDGFIGIDVGINFCGGKMCGDFDFEEVSTKASLITPVPGGVGPMTIAMIVHNLIKAKDINIDLED